MIIGIIMFVPGDEVKLNIEKTGLFVKITYTQMRRCQKRKAHPATVWNGPRSFYIKLL